MSESRVQRKDFNQIQYEENVKRQQEEGEQEESESAAGTADPNKSETSESDEWEKYRGSHEPAEHWQLRKEFLKRNEGRFEKNRLLSLSQAFANMEFLGCKYPIETMELVAELSTGIVEDYRAAKKGRLQRTFVKASDAAERKTKGQNGSRDKQKVNSSFNTSTEHQRLVPAKVLDSYIPKVSSKNVALQSIISLHQQELTRLTETEEIMETGCEETQSQQAKEEEKGNERLKYPLPEDIDVTLRKSFDAIKIFSSSAGEILKAVDKSVATVTDMKGTMELLKTFYIVETISDAHNDVTVLTQSFSMCHKNDYLNFDFPPYNISQGVNMRCSMIIGPPKKPCMTIHGQGKGQKEAKRDACEKAVKLLKQLRPVIKIKQVSNRIVERREIFPVKKSGAPPLPKMPPLAENSFAMKMMKKMGWKGGGLGKNEDGILQPVAEPVAHNTRLGLGADRNSSIEFDANVTELLRIEQETLFTLSCDIEFATDFSKGERKLIHNIAQKLGFVSKSYGQGDNRRLVVSRKTDPEQLFREVMHAGGETPKYKVILPDCWQSR